jgi:hypothetical protein
VVGIVGGKGVQVVASKWLCALLDLPVGVDRRFVPDVAGSIIVGRAKRLGAVDNEIAEHQPSADARDREVDVLVAGDA